MIKTQGIILKEADLNEVDRLLTIYTKELGKIRVSAKGVKKLESKLRYSIEPMSLVQLILVEGKNYLILKDSVIINQFLEIKKDLNKFKKVKEIVEIIDEAIVGEEKDEDIWKLILQSFKDLNINDFKKKLISLLGYDPKEMNIEDIY